MPVFVPVELPCNTVNEIDRQAKTVQKTREQFIAELIEAYIKGEKT